MNFLTRLKARYRATSHRPPPEGSPKAPEGYEPLSEETILLGDPKNRRGSVIEGVRLPASKNEKGAVHRFDLPALTLVGLYRQRRRVELLFRWLEGQLGALRPSGASEEAVWLTIMEAAIVALLTASL